VAIWSCDELNKCRHGWQYLFFLPAGWALVVMVIGVSVIPSEPPKKETDDRRVDWVGAGIITFGLSLFSFSITQGGLVEGGWKNACESHSLSRSCQTFLSSSSSLCSSSWPLVSGSTMSPIIRPSRR